MTQLRATSGVFEGMTTAELKGQLKERGLPISGKKAELVERLQAATAGGSTSGPVEEKEEAPEITGADDPDAITEQPPQPPYGCTLPDPHEGKPETIMDEDGRKRYLCLDGQYRRGDPDCIECKPENFEQWLTEWVVAARTDQLEGLPQKTFLPDEKLESNPKGSESKAGRELKTEDVLSKSQGPDGRPVWEVKAAFTKV